MDFKKLLTLLEYELAEQEKLLELLSQERTAIVKLNREQIEEIQKKKQAALQTAQAVGSRREAFLSAGVSAEQPQKLSTLIKNCSQRDIRDKLEGIGKELKKTCTSVQKMNAHNAELIKQSLGLVVSTLAIFRAVPEADLPSYNQTGTLQSADDPAFARRPSRLISEA